MTGLNGSSFEGRGGIGLRGAGHAELGAERTGLPLTVLLFAADVNDHTTLEDVLDSPAGDPAAARAAPVAVQAAIAGPFASTC